jgi:hypothetical protein
MPSHVTNLTEKEARLACSNTKPRVLPTKLFEHAFACHERKDSTSVKYIKDHGVTFQFARVDGVPDFFGRYREGHNKSGFTLDHICFPNRLSSHPEL